jgi:hypothetical protein
MKSEFRTSKFRLIGGAAFAAIGLTIVILILLNVFPKHVHSNFIKDSINKFTANIGTNSDSLQVEAERIKVDRQCLSELIKSMPTEDISKVQWKVSKKLFRLASKHDIRLVNVKYTPVSKIETSAITLESTSIDFDVIGIYKNLKTFMLAVEQDEPNFIVTDARLEETAEGGHLVVRLSVFWRPSLVTVK